MSLRTNLIRATAAVALAGGALAAAAAPAAAAEFKYFTTLSSGTCDTATGEWVVDWALSNQSTEIATLSNVVFSTPASGVPATVDGKTTVHVFTRVPGNGTQGSVNFTATWADCTSAPNSWYFRPFTPCAKAAKETGWSVTDADGVTRGSISGEPHLANVCDRLADGVTVSVEAQLSDGSIVKRIAPLGGCTPFQPFNGSDITAVRGFAGDFANDWHPVS